MARIPWLLIVLATTTTLANAQKCAHAKEINDTSAVRRLLETSYGLDSTVAHPAFRQLRSMDSTAIPALVALLCGVDAGKRDENSLDLSYLAGDFLSHMGRPGIRALVGALADNDTALANNAVTVLELAVARGGRRDIDPTPELLPLLSDARPEVRKRAAGLVRLDGSDRQAAIAAMTKALADPDSGVRGAVAWRLFDMRDDSRALVPALVRALHDPAATVRRAAARAVGWSRTWDSTAVNALTALLEDPDPDVREAAAGALGDLGVAAASGVPALMTSLGDQNESIRANVTVSLGKIGADSVGGETRAPILAALATALVDRDSSVRELAARALREIGVPAAAHDITALRNRDPKVRVMAIQALAEQPPSPQAIDALVTLLRDPHRDVRAEAVSALGGFGPTVEPRMRTLAASRDEILRRSAGKVLDYLKDVDRLPIADRCFDLALAPWSPNLGLEEDTVFSTPPMTVRFTRIKNSWFASNDRLSFRVAPANGARMSVHGPGLWTPVAGKDSVSIVWSTGFSGLTMKLAVAADTLRGEARTFWDFDRARQTARVIGLRVPCR